MMIEAFLGVGRDIIVVYLEVAVVRCLGRRLSGLAILIVIRMAIAGYPSGSLGGRSRRRTRGEAQHEMHVMQML